jgi:hypothetical protein
MSALPPCWAHATPTPVGESRTFTWPRSRAACLTASLLSRDTQRAKVGSPRSGSAPCSRLAQAGCGSGARRLAVPEDPPFPLSRVSLDGTKAEAEVQDTEVKILEALAAAGEPIHETSTEVREGLRARVEARTSVFVQGLRRPVEAGKVVRTGEGRRGNPYLYALPYPSTPRCSRDRLRGGGCPGGPWGASF